MGLAAQSREAAAGSGGRRHMARIVALEPARRRDAAGWRVVEMVAARRGVPARLLLHRSRCVEPVASARQLAMYLMHVTLQRPYAEVGRFFGRDRTTVAHACARIEDQRDDDPLETEVAALEAALAVADDEAGARCHAAR